MSAETKEASARATFADATTCGDHPIDLAWEDVADVLHAWSNNGEEGYADTESFCVVRLKDGRFAVVTEWSDTTGHGCQCDGKATFWATEDEAVRLGLSREDREHLTLPHPTEGEG